MKGRSFGRRFGKIDLPKPVKVGEEYDVEINEVGSKGDGIARVKNFVVFVNGTKKGDKVHIRIKEVRNRFAIGEKAEPSEVEEVREEIEE
ncbi:MAG: TRAM domain-containing protein [Candidatus Aenigmatarchaeota archaeon]